MKYKKYLKSLNIGSLVKDIADIMQISSCKIVNVLNPVRYEGNENKIFKLNDIDTKDLVRISFLLNYNFLERLSNEYLPMLPVTGNRFEPIKYTFKLDPSTKSYSIAGQSGDCSFLDNLHVGAYIRKVAEDNGYTEKEVGVRLGYTQSVVSEIYKSDSIKVKKLFWISEKLQRHFVYELFLSKIKIIPSYSALYQIEISFDEQTVCINNPCDNSVIFKYLRYYGEM